MPLVLNSKSLCAEVSVSAHGLLLVGKRVSIDFSSHGFKIKVSIHFILSNRHLIFEKKNEECSHIRQEATIFRNFTRKLE